MQVQGRPFEISDGTLRSTIPLADPTSPAPADSDSRACDRHQAGAADRMRKKWSWLSKFAGWSGHAALVAVWPEFGSTHYA
jgi:hypothetical protein